MNTADIQDMLIHMRHEEPVRYYAFLQELVSFMEGAVQKLDRPS